MKKIIMFIIMVFALLGMGLSTTASEIPDTLVIHYFRYDDQYTDFNMWVWQSEPTSLGGIQHHFDTLQKDEYGVYYEINLNADYPNAISLGIIIKQGSWDGYREVGGDRFIDLTNIEVVNNVAHAYFVEQDLQIGTSASDLANHIPDYRAKILMVAFDTQKRITARLTHIPTQGYEVYENDTLVLSGTSSITTLLLTVPSVDISKTYTLKVMFSDVLTVEKVVSLQNLYDTQDFENLYTYSGTLGVSQEDEFTVFRLWAPLSQSVALNLYQQGHPNYNDLGELNDELTPYQTEPLYKIESGVWEIKLTGNFDFKYYTFVVNNNGISNEVVDPYAYSTGANGQRGMIVNFSLVNPEGWAYNSRPNTITHLTDYIVYELQIRDLTTHSSWNGTESYRGTFMGLAESGTTYTGDGVTVTTGLDHLEELGITAVQLLPIFDFGYVDEIQEWSNPNYPNAFNWGYMPYNFNTLEGSFSTNPFDGKTRINEFKQAVMALHDKDIRVIMDVVYNHTGESSTSNFNKIVPGYYHRMTPEGGFYNGSGTGNETASDRSMMNKFMVDSVKFWATEYNLSGFRFDLMALHDVDTMNDIQATLEAIDPTLIVYGEPWTGGTSPLDESIRADKDNIKDLNMVGAFNDVTRDAIKGSVFQATEKGWVQGNVTTSNVEGIMYGIVGGIDYPGLNLVSAWHLNPNQTINYVSAHDNNTLYDKLKLTNVKSTEIEAEQIQANAIILTSQGIPFLHAGVDFMRSKPSLNGGFDENSYESPDLVNQLRWDRKAQYVNVFEYYKALIEIRKTYSHFRISDSAQILARLQFVDANSGLQAIAFKIDGLDNEPDIFVIHSGNPTGGLAQVNLDAGKTYRLLTYTDSTNLNGIEIVSGSVFVPAHTTAILVEVVIDSITINEPVVSIDLGSEFIPSTNITVNNPNVTIYYSDYYDVSISGRYTITVAVIESYGQVRHYFYTLYVHGNDFNVIIDETNIGG